MDWSVEHESGENGRKHQPIFRLDRSFRTASRSVTFEHMLAWFEARDVEHAPDESTIRRKITPVWRELSR
jgi:hypothetical protein